MSARRSAVVTVRVPVDNPDGRGEITAQVRLHWPARTPAAVVNSVLGQAIEAIEVSAGLTGGDR